MIPDFEKMNERMEQASLHELMPDFNKEQEWSKLSQQLHPLKKRISVWYYAAAILLLLAGGSWLTLFLSGAHDRQVVLVASDKVKIPSPQKPIKTEQFGKADTSLNLKPAVVQSDTHENVINTSTDKNAVATKKHKQVREAYDPGNNYITKNIICNGTPCPIQISINQTMKCPNIQPTTISSCSTLEPAQSGQLSYKPHDKIAKNCSLTISEIEIKSIATGETILLNANSTPSTAQDVFSYITGQKKGDILAGMFNSDCNHKTQKHNLRIDNSYGKLVIE